MKKLLTIAIATIALCTHAEVPPFQTKTFEFVPAHPTNQVILYRIYLVQLPNLPGTTNFYGTTTSNRFTITNMLAMPQRVYVSSSNVWGEGDWSAPYEMPTKPAPPTDIKPISTTLIGVPLPGVVEGSVDLVNWTTRIRLTQPVDDKLSFTHTLLPGEQNMFWRAKAMPLAAKTPPLPAKAPPLP